MLEAMVSDVIVNFIHGSIFSAEIKLQVMQWRRLSEIFGNFIFFDKDSLFHSS
jgi:hypothetical protein